MSIANVKQELIQAGHDSECVNACFDNHTDIKDVTKYASDMMFQYIRQNNKEKAKQFKDIAKALNDRVTLKQEHQPQEQTISTIQPTSINESMLNVEAKNEIPEILLEQQNVERDIQTDPEVKDVVENGMQSVEQQVEQMPDQRDDELETLRAQVEQLKNEQQAVKQQPGEQISKYDKFIYAISPGGIVHGIGKLASWAWGKTFGGK